MSWLKSYSFPFAKNPFPFSIMVGMMMMMTIMMTVGVDGDVLISDLVVGLPILLCSYAHAYAYATGIKINNNVLFNNQDPSSFLSLVSSWLTHFKIVIYYFARAGERVGVLRRRFMKEF